MLSIENGDLERQPTQCKNREEEHEHNDNLEREAREALNMSSCLWLGRQYNRPEMPFNPLSNDNFIGAMAPFEFRSILVV